jgi:hypothetical protein
MNLQKLRDSKEASLEYTYLSEVAKRLSKILGEWLTADEVIAMMDVITLYSFQFNDGFVINDIQDEMIGRSDAAAIAACFSKDQGKNSLWWKAEYSAHDKESEEYQVVSGRILAEITRAPIIRSTTK